MRKVKKNAVAVPAKGPAKVGLAASAGSPARRPASEWSFQSGATGWNGVCAVSDDGVSVLRRRGDDGRTDEYVGYTFDELCAASAQRYLAELLGAGMAESVLSEASSRWGKTIARVAPPAAPVQSKAPPADADPWRERRKRWLLRYRALRTTVVKIVRRPFERQARTGQWDVEALSSLCSLLIGVGLMLWLTGLAVIELRNEGRVWWHARMAQDLVAVQARVVSHDLDEFRSDGSWGHKNNPSRNVATYYATPVVGFEYRDEWGDTTRGRSAFAERFDRRAQALALMAKRFPVGAEVAMLKVPGKDGRLLFSADQSPSTGGMLVRVVTEILLLVFIYLPLVVMAAFAIPAVLIFVVAWPISRWRA